MWPYMGSMGWWMVLWWVAGIVVLVLVVRLVAGAAGGFSPRGDETPEQILSDVTRRAKWSATSTNGAWTISPLGVTSTRIQLLEGAL